MRKIAVCLASVLVGVLLFGCSGPRVDGSWMWVDTETGNAFFSVNFVSESVGWLNGQTDRSSIPVDEEEEEKVAATEKKAKPEEDPLKANQGFEVLRTTDGGETWAPIPGLFENKIRSVWFVDPMIGWALTIERDILATVDGGETWNIQRKAGTVKLKLHGNPRQPELDQPDQIENIRFVDARHGWAWGGGRMDDYSEQPGVFLATVDGGLNWNEIPYPFEQNIWSIFFLDARYAWASTAEGGFYGTSDGGITWAKLEGRRPELKFDSIFFVDESNGWLVGHSGRIAKTTDGGQTWSRMFMIRPEFVMRDIYFLDPKRGWAVGDKGAILYTADGGSSWLDVSAPEAPNLRELIFINDGLGWAAGTRGALFKFKTG